MSFKRKSGHDLHSLKQVGHGNSPAPCMQSALDLYLMQLCMCMLRLPHCENMVQGITREGDCKATLRL